MQHFVLQTVACWGGALQSVAMRYDSVVHIDLTQSLLVLAPTDYAALKAQAALQGGHACTQAVATQQPLPVCAQTLLLMFEIRQPNPLMP